MKLISFIADFFKDQKDGSSSKRLSLFVCLVFLGMMVNGSLKGIKIDFNVLIVVAGIILFDIGAITSEFFKDSLQKPKDE